VGKIGVLVAIEHSDKAKAEALGKQLAMHIAAAKPDVLTIADVDPAKLARERDIIAEQTKASGKPAEIVAKMVDGRVRKYYEEVVLMEQTSMIDGETKIAKLLDSAGAKLPAFVRFGLGEGIEKQQSDFAAEVAAQAKLAS
jgi:elongation factor Ts